MVSNGSILTPSFVRMSNLRLCFGYSWGEKYDFSVCCTHLLAPLMARITISYMPWEAFLVWGPETWVLGVLHPTVWWRTSRTHYIFWLALRYPYLSRIQAYCVDATFEITCASKNATELQSALVLDCFLHLPIDFGWQNVLLRMAVGPVRARFRRAKHYCIDSWWVPAAEEVSVGASTGISG